MRGNVDNRSNVEYIVEKLFPHFGRFINGSGNFWDQVFTLIFVITIALIFLPNFDFSYSDNLNEFIRYNLPHSTHGWLYLFLFLLLVVVAVRNTWNIFNNWLFLNNLKTVEKDPVTLKISGRDLEEEQIENLAYSWYKVSCELNVDSQKQWRASIRFGSKKNTLDVELYVSDTPGKEEDTKLRLRRIYASDNLPLQIDDRHEITQYDQKEIIHIEVLNNNGILEVSIEHNGVEKTISDMLVNPKMSGDIILRAWHGPSNVKPPEETRVVKFKKIVLIK